MTVRFDSNADAVFIRLDECKKVEESQEVEPGVILDYDSEGKVIGIELLRVKDRVSMDQLKELKFQLAT